MIIEDISFKFKSNYCKGLLWNIYICLDLVVILEENIFIFGFCE